MVDEYRKRMRDMRVEFDAMSEAKCANADGSDGKSGGGEGNSGRQGKMLLGRIAKISMTWRLELMRSAKQCVLKGSAGCDRHSGRT
jgi:hypothetical protein